MALRLEGFGAVKECRNDEKWESFRSLCFAVSAHGKRKSQTMHTRVASFSAFAWVKSLSDGSRSSWSFLRFEAAAAAVSIFILVGLASAAEQQTAAKAASAGATPSAPEVIPLADIAARSTDVGNLIRSLSTTTVPTPEIETISKSLPELSKRLDEHLAETTTILKVEPSLENLQTLQQEWNRQQVEITAWLTTLTRQVTGLQNGLNQLTELQKTWNNTGTAAQDSKAPDPILEQINATLASISETQTKLSSARTVLLDLQSHVAQELSKCGTVLSEIEQLQETVVAGIFVRTATPLWRVDFWSDAFQALPEHLRKISHNRWADVGSYIREPSRGSGLHGAFLIVVALAFLLARRKLDQWTKSGSSVSPGLLVFERPFSAALVAVLVLVTSPFIQISLPVRQLLTIIALVPMLRITRRVVSPSVAALSYAVCVLFTLDTVRQAYAGIQVIGQVILVIETFAAIIALFRMRRHYRQLLAERAESSRLMLLRSARFILLTVLFVALVAATAGYLRLARLLTPGIFVGGVLALAALSYLRIVGGVVAMAFRLWPLRSLRMVEHHRDFLARKIYRWLVWGAVLGWSTRYLSYLGLLDPTWSLVQAALVAKLQRGTISISLGNILEFLLAVTAAYLLSRFLRFVLQEDFYPRINLAPGLSYAVSSLLNYIIIALGFVAGLGVLGVDFTKVSVLAGAFGVGIGFGLQSIVNNFVSGLILLFERPIHVGDAIQINNLQGRVRRIGIRASVLRTLQGAEIIVPNAQLITEQVTNWTLSDQLRRVELPVGVNYGAQPKKVIELLEGVARAHPDVLQDPAPRCLFMSYGDSSINFELRVWSEYTKSQQVHSDLSVAVYDAVNAAGMSFPFPQREVRLLSNGEGAPAVLSSSTEEKPRK